MVKKSLILLSAIFLVACCGACADSNLSVDLMLPLYISSDTALQTSVVVKGDPEFWTMSKPHRFQDKLSATDPVVHCGQVMQAPPQGVEFGFVLNVLNESNL